MRRHRRSAEEPAGVSRLDVVIEPVVVGPAGRRGKGRIHGFEGRDVHGGRGIEDGEIQSLFVHGQELRGRVEVPGNFIGVARPRVVSSARESAGQSPPGMAAMTSFYDVRISQRRSLRRRGARSLKAGSM